jgi:microcystin-dependent protein
MSEPFLSEIKIFSFNFAPKGWAQCNGQLLPINQNQALFSLLGTTYGGNGQTNFALPDLRGRSQLHNGNSFLLGQVGGEENHTLTIQETPTHIHTLPNTNNAVTGGNANATTVNPGYTTAGSNAQMGNATVSSLGGQPHNNMSPYLVLNFCIALQGIFPSRN